MENYDYAALAKRNNEGTTWTRFSSEHITDMDESYLNEITPHVLFYQRVGLSDNEEQAFISEV